VGTIAELTFTRHGSTWDVRVLQDGATASATLGATSITRTQGQRNAALVSAILGTSVITKIEDEGSFLFDRLESNPIGDFDLEIDRDGSRWHEGSLQRIRPSSTTYDPSLTLEWGDRISELGRPGMYLRPDGAGTYSDTLQWRPEYQPSGQIYHEIPAVGAALLHPVTALDVRTYWNYAHTDYDPGREKSRAHRIRLLDLARDDFPTTRLRALQKWCAFFGLQAVQEDGKIQLLERAMRGQASRYADHTTTSFSPAGVGGTSPIPLQAQDIYTRISGQDKEVGRQIRQPRYTAFESQRYVAHADDDQFPLPGATEPFSSPAQYPLTDVWTINGSVADWRADAIVMDANSGSVERVEPWERPDGGFTEMAVEIEIEIDVLSGATFDGGSAQLPVAILYESSQSSSSQLIFTVLLTDDDAGTTVTKSLSQPIQEDHEARLKLETDFNPDGDNATEIDEVRYEDVRATYTTDVDSRAPSFVDQDPGESIKQTASVIGAYDTAPLITSAGVIGVYQGTTSGGWGRLLTDTWTHPTAASSADLLSQRDDVLTAQMTPRDNPIKGLEVWQDMDAPGGIAASYTFESTTWVPVYVKTDLNKGVRVMQLYELRT